MTACVRCGADLTVPPHSKLCWQGVPNAKDGAKGDLCDPCHREWEAEKKAPKGSGWEFVSEPDLVRPGSWGNGDGQWKKGEDPL